MIDIDTEALQNITAVLEQAAGSIDEAANQLMQITTHENWGCAEKVQINDYALTCRGQIQKLQTVSQNFCQIIREVSQDFVDTEASISGMFENVEKLISEILSVPVSETVMKPRTLSVGSAITSLMNESTTWKKPSIWEKSGSMFSSVLDVDKIRPAYHSCNGIDEGGLSVVSMKDLLL